MDLLLVVVVVLVAVVVLGLGLLVRGRGGAPAPPRPEAPPREPGTTEPETTGTEGPGAGGDTDVLEAPPDVAEPDVAEPEVLEPEAPPEAPPEPATLAERFQQRLTRTRNKLGTRVAELFGAGVSDEAWEGLEETLITADVGVEATLEIVEELRRRAREEGATDADTVVALLKDELRTQLGSVDRTLARTRDDEPSVWLMVGVNGTGKTTTIGKLAAIEAREGRSAVLAAADTFRAAAADQLAVWGGRTDARVVRKEEGSDPASVAYDGYMAARATDADLLLIDTAGRLHNRRELMDELVKVKRVVEKQAGALEETLLVLDATTGQNGIQQAQAFTEAVDVTGIALTKLDGSSKGGIVIAVQRQLGIPVKLVGLGEDVDDLAVFEADAFVEGLFSDLPVR